MEMKFNSVTNCLVGVGVDGSASNGIMTDCRQSLDSSVNPAFLTSTRCRLGRLVDDVDCFEDGCGRIWKRKSVVRAVDGSGGVLRNGGCNCVGDGSCSVVGKSFGRNRCYRRRKGVVSSNHLYNVSRITRIATVNVDTFLQTRRAVLVLNELSRYKVDLAGLQEVRWPGSGEIFMGISFGVFCPK